MDVRLARVYRQTLQLASQCANSKGPLLESDVSPLSETTERDDATQLRLMKRSAWLRVNCSHHPQLAQQRPSAQEWRHEAFDAIAKAWGRLLSLVGLRW